MPVVRCQTTAVIKPENGQKVKCSTTGDGQAVIIAGGRPVLIDNVPPTKNDHGQQCEAYRVHEQEDETLRE